MSFIPVLAKLIFFFHM